MPAASSPAEARRGSSRRRARSPAADQVTDTVVAFVHNPFVPPCSPTTPQSLVGTSAAREADLADLSSRLDVMQAAWEFPHFCRGGDSTSCAVWRAKEGVAEASPPGPRERRHVYLPLIPSAGGPFPLSRGRREGLCLLALTIVFPTAIIESAPEGAGRKGKLLAAVGLPRGPARARVARGHRLSGGNRPARQPLPLNRASITTTPKRPRWRLLEPYRARSCVGCVYAGGLTPTAPRAHAQAPPLPFGEVADPRHPARGEGARGRRGDAVGALHSLRRAEAPGLHRVQARMGRGALGGGAAL